MAAFKSEANNPIMLKISLGLEIFFALNILLHFFLTYEEETNKSHIHISDLNKIALHYLQTGFIRDLIPLIPFQVFYMSGYERFFYIIKIIRLYSGLKLLNIPAIMSQVKYQYKKKLDRMVENDYLLGEDKI